MRHLIPAIVISALLLPAAPGLAHAQDATAPSATADLDITDDRVRYLDDLRRVSPTRHATGPPHA